MKYFEYINSPVGMLCIIASRDALESVQFVSSKQASLHKHDAMHRGVNDIIAATTKQLNEYFQGKRSKFTLPYVVSGTPFQEKVWASLATIPFGATRSYKEQACMVGNPRAIRAVARTNGQNPLCIILPCHRIIGSDGSLTGYVGGLAIKQQLLALEQQTFPAG
jgi:methylated-DNA-[protein]-cysteine S-methyltransferase